MQPQRHKQFKMRPEQPDKPIVPLIEEYYGSRDKALEAIKKLPASK